MINYKSFKLTDGAKLRVRTENIVATVSSKTSNTIDLYVAGLDRALHIPVSDSKDATEVIDFIWERPNRELEREDI